MLIVFIRGLIVYALVIFATRAMGKRQLGELSPSELVITILISNIATLSMENPSLPILTGIVPILTLVCLDILASYAALKSRKIRHILTGRPKIIISEGKIDQKMLSELRLSIDDVCAAMRNSGIFDITQVEYAVVETTGQISVLEKKEYRPLSLSDVGQAIGDKNVGESHEDKNGFDVPQLAISDGIIVAEKYVSREQLLSELKKKKLSPKDVLLCLAYPDKTLKIIKKEYK